MARAERLVRNLRDLAAWVEPRALDEDIRRGLGGQESAGLIVATKRGNARGAKEPYRSHAEARRTEDRLGKRPITEEERQIATQLGWAEWRRVSPKFADRRLKLFLKAKQDPKFRFYSLKGQILLKDVLRTAWEIVRANRGAAGVDGVSVHHIDNAEGGSEKLVDTLYEELRSKSYKPQPVRRVYIPKPDGRERPLGIPTVRDRVVQTAVLLVLEPIFEADFLGVSHGFRAGRKAHDALAVIRKELLAGRKEVYDADLKEFFDSIPWDKLFEALRMRVTDSSVLKLIRLWLEAPIVDERDGGPPRRGKKGTPQGGVISPLLANVYLHWFDRFFHMRDGPAHFAGARLVRYADDFVVMARHQGPRLKRWIEETLEHRMGLTLNREKTQVVDLKKPGASVDFLGYTFRFDRDLKGRNRTYLNVFPSKKALARERAVLRQMTGPRMGFVPIPALIATVNRHLRGWANYFSFGYPRIAKRAINAFVMQRLKLHLQRRSQRPFRPPEGRSFYAHLRSLGLVYL